MDRQDILVVPERARKAVIAALIEFLGLLAAPTYAKRLIGFLLIAVGLTWKQVAELMPVTECTVRTWRGYVSSFAAVSDVTCQTCCHPGV